MRSIRRINVSHNILRSLPKEICELYTLEKIESGDNRVRSIPSSVSKLTRLTLLSLKNNNLRVLPPELGQCVKLKYLSLYANDLVALPDEICNLKSLVRLSAQANNMVKLPWLLGELASLKTFDISANPVRSFPPSLGALENSLESLEMLDCDDLKDPPPMIVSQGQKHILTYLRKIWRGFNTRRMVLVGLRMGIVAFDLSHPGLADLVELRVDKNKLQVLPPTLGLLEKLISLRLRENYLETLPPTLTCLTSLQELDVSKNRLRLLPRGVLALTCLERLRCGDNPIPYAVSTEWIEENVQKFLTSYVRDTIGKRISAMWNNNNLGEVFLAWAQYVSDAQRSDDDERLNND
jgi:Leucine-rich repeat (LRR) protein